MARYNGTVTTTRKGPVAYVQWDHPPVNVFSGRLLREFARALRSPDVTTSHVVVLRGLGRCWSAGLDVQEHLRPGVVAMLESFDGALRALWDIPVPTVAQIHGACLGGGLEIVNVCDLAYASESASLGQPEIRLGVFPPMAAVHLPSALGPKRAAQLLYSGEPVPAAEAERIGLVNRVVPDADLQDRVDEFAQTLGSRKRSALVHLKAGLRSATGTPWQPLAAVERIYLQGLMQEPDAEEGLHAFLERRQERPA